MTGENGVKTTGIPLTNLITYSRFCHRCERTTVVMIIPNFIGRCKSTSVRARSRRQRTLPETSELSNVIHWTMEQFRAK